jgi:hypothetical protein
MSSSSIAGFTSPFANSGELGLGIASILGGSASTTSNASSVVAASETASSGPFSALEASAASVANKSATVDALDEGKLTGEQYNVLSAVASSTTPTTLPWNSDGTEPTTIAQIRQYGWIKLVEPIYDSTSHSVTGGEYELTAVGQAIFNRTGGGKIGASSSSVDTTA